MIDAMKIERLRRVIKDTENAKEFSRMLSKEASISEKKK